MNSRIMMVGSLLLLACGSSGVVESEGNLPEATGSGPFTPPPFVPLADCLTNQNLRGLTEAEVQACAGDPCSQAVDHVDPMVTISWRLYCAEPVCAQDCYWHVRVYFENGVVSYARVRHP